MNPFTTIKVLIVDDSAIVRKILSETLAGEKDIEVVGTAPDPYVARDKILSLAPDVLTLDIEMPRMDGLTFLKKIMQHHPMPVVIISSLAQSSTRQALEALRLGAVEVLPKPGGPYSVGELRQILPNKIRAAKLAQLRKSGLREETPSAPLPILPPSARRRPILIAIGASTGGTEAIESVLTKMPADAPAIVITQHIPAGFSRAFADRLNGVCKIRVKEAENGDEVVPGRALVAPGDFHMIIERAVAGHRVVVKKGPRVCYQRPSVDVMFDSVASVAGKDSVGVLLTGMGSDGAQGLLKMRNAGASTIAQDEATCIVFGMPREAIKMDAAERILPLPNIPGAILRLVSEKLSPVSPAA